VIYVEYGYPRIYRQNFATIAPRKLAKNEKKKKGKKKKKKKKNLKKKKETSRNFRATILSFFL